MKILYFAGNRPGAQIQLLDIIKHCPQHEFKIASYKSSKLKYIDWLLDPLINVYSQDLINAVIKTKITKYKEQLNLNTNYKLYNQLREDIKQYNPQLIITDMEEFGLAIASDLNIEVWSCSPLNIYEFVQFRTNDFISKFSFSIRNFKDNYLCHGLSTTANKTIIYSPLHCTNSIFGNLSVSQSSKDFYWAVPYHISSPKIEDKTETILIAPNDRIKKLSKIFEASKIPCKIFSDYTDDYVKTLPKTDLMFFTGETRSLTDAIYNDIRNICVLPDIKDWESIINATVGALLLPCFTLGTLELMGLSALDGITAVYNKCQIFKHDVTIRKLRNPYHVQFHDILKEFEKTL
jgi:hypothetical protein